MVDRAAIEVYLEAGQSRIFAAALDWPGWCRSGKDESAALQALFAYGPRYARVFQRTGLGFRTPSQPSDLVVVERVAGNTTTDFGAPGATLPYDADPANPAELERWQVVLQACWQAFDAAVQAAAGRSLSKGPRGGGRELTKIIEHVLGADASYLNSLGGKLKLSSNYTTDQALAQTRQAVLTTLVAAARGEVPERGPRGGWLDENTFFIEYDEISNLEAFLITLKFEGDQANLTIEDLTYHNSITIPGRVQ